MSQLIRPAVIEAWAAFSEPLENRLPYMYLDILGYVTTAVGVLVDTELSAMALPWKDRYGKPATSHQIRTEWRALKARQDLAQYHHREAARLTTIRLTEADIDAIVDQRRAQAAQVLTKRFPEFPAWPADAQLATLSMAWAMGSHFWLKFPLWSGFADKRDWKSCAAAGKIREAGNPGVVPRNQLNRAHFREADTWLGRRMPEILNGPCTLAALRAGWKTSEPVVPLPLP